jgi:hypothetical protein
MVSPASSSPCVVFPAWAKLSREAVMAATNHWRLHVPVLLITFVVFPLFDLAFKPLLFPLVTPTLYAGILFLCTLPSTVNPQSPHGHGEGQRRQGQRLASVSSSSSRRWC